MTEALLWSEGRIVADSSSRTLHPGYLADGDAAPTLRIVAGKRYLLPFEAEVAMKAGDEEIRGERVAIRPTRSGDSVVLAVPPDLDALDRFVPFASLGMLRRLVHRQQREGILVPHDTHTLATEEGRTAYAEYVQAVTFAKVIGWMRHPDTGECVASAVLNVRMPTATYGGQLWWVIGGHNVLPDAERSQGGAHRPSASSLGTTLAKEGAEEAQIIRESDGAATPFAPREKRAGRRVRVLGYGRSSDRVGKVHEPVLVVILLAEGEQLIVRDPSESLGFVPAPLAEWMRFMGGVATEEDHDLIRRCVVSGLEKELARSDKRAMAKRRALIERQLTQFFGKRNRAGERTGFALTPAQHTPPIDRLSLGAVEQLCVRWGLLSGLFRATRQ